MTYFAYVPITISSLTAQNSQSFDFIHFWQIWEKPTYSAMIPNLYTEYVTNCGFQVSALDTRLTYLRYSSMRSVSPRRLTLPSQSGCDISWNTSWWPEQVISITYSPSLFDFEMIFCDGWNWTALARSAMDFLNVSWKVWVFPRCTPKLSFAHVLKSYLSGSSNAWSSTSSASWMRSILYWIGNPILPVRERDTTKYGNRP